jgi:hypothetical protein
VPRNGANASAPATAAGWTVGRVFFVLVLVVLVVLVLVVLIV